MAVAPAANEMDANGPECPLAGTKRPTDAGEWLHTVRPQNRRGCEIWRQIVLSSLANRCARDVDGHVNLGARGGLVISRKLDRQQTQDDLATAAGVPPKTIAAFEAEGRAPRGATVEGIQAALEAGGGVYRDRQRRRGDPAIIEKGARPPGQHRAGGRLTL